VARSQLPAKTTDGDGGYYAKREEIEAWRRKTHTQARKELYGIVAGSIGNIEAWRKLGINVTPAQLAKIWETIDISSSDGQLVVLSVASLLAAASADSDKMVSVVRAAGNIENRLYKRVHGWGGQNPVTNINIFNTAQRLDESKRKVREIAGIDFEPPKPRAIATADGPGDGGQVAVVDGDPAPVGEQGG